MADTSNVVPVSGSNYFGQVAAKKKSDLSMTTFLNLLVTQLQNQDPMKPMDDSSFYAQIAQLGQVQGMEKLNSSADLGQAQALMGKTVTAIRPTSSSSGKSGEVFTGEVTKIIFKNGNQYLGVQEANGGTVEVQLPAIQSVIPTVDVASMSSLIGKTVSGPVVTNGKATSVVGVVQGITSDGGAAYAQVKTSDGKIVPVPVSSLENILG
jgi:flagellar basal-body rod modification protein FlgD